jgi:hypothetical protein
MRITLDIDLEREAVQCWEGGFDQPALPWQESALPLERDQQRALFAGFTQAFGTRDRDARHLFTRMLLGYEPDQQVSWAPASDHAITKAHASRILDVIDAIERTHVLVDAKAFGLTG